MSNNDDDQVTLQSCDGKDFKVQVKIAKKSETIKNLIEDAGIELSIPLPNVSAKVLARVITYCKHHDENPSSSSETKEGDEKRTDNISTWDLAFTGELSQPDLFELILAANYLDINSLLDMLCKTVANMIKGKTPEEVKKTFNITKDFTPEEEEQVRKENEWCEEQ